MPDFHETFESLAAWELDDFAAAQTFISRARATDGETSLRISYDTQFPTRNGFGMQRIDTVDGGVPGTWYYLAYSFFLEDWAQVWNTGYGGDGIGNDGFPMPNFISIADLSAEWFEGAGGLLAPLSETTGEIRVGTSTTGQIVAPVTAGEWHTLRHAVRYTTTTVFAKLWLDGALIIDGENGPYLDPYDDPPPAVGVVLGTDSNARGTLYIDDMRWGVGVDPGDSSTADTAPGTSTSQWVKIREKTSSLVVDVSIELDPPESEAWAYAEVYIPQNLLSTLGSNDYTFFIRSDFVNIGVKRVALTSAYNWIHQGLFINGEIITPVVPDSWNRVEFHQKAGESTIDIRINGLLFENLSILGGPIDEVSYLSARSPYQTPPETLDVYIGVDNMAFSLEGWVGDHREILYLWDFEGVDPLNEAIANYPDPPFDARFGPDGDRTTIEEGGVPGPGPGLPTPFPPPGGGGGGGGDPGGGGGGSGGAGFGGFSGRRFFKSFPWRCIVVDGSIDEFGDDTGEGATITMLDRLAGDREMVVKIGEARTWRTVVPSYEPQVNITHDDPWEEAFVAEGNRLLYVFRREGGAPLWKCHGGFLLQKLADTAETEDSHSTIYGYDPRQLLYSRKAMNPETGGNISKAGYTYVGEDAGQIAFQVLFVSTYGVGAVFGQGFDRIDNESDNILTDPDESTIDSFHITQGMSVGEVWDELEATGKLEIYLEPLYDPFGFPGYLARAFYYTQMGEENSSAVFAWDKPSRSLEGVDHEKDGTQRGNIIRFGRGQGGKVVDEVEDLASIAKYGRYYKQQWFPVQKKGAAVTALAEGELEASTDGRRTVQIQPSPERSPVPLRDYQLGDTVPVYWSRNLRQGLFVPSRIVEIPIRITDDGLEQVQRAVVEPEEWVIGEG